MSSRSSQPCLVLLLLVLTASVSPVKGEDAQHGTPDAEAILQAARMNPTTHSASLKARIRGEEGNITPLVIRLKDGAVRYEFTQPEQVITLKLSPEETQMSETLDGKTKPVSPAHRHDPIRNSGITYQDLSLGFLYWPHPVIQGEETVKTRSSWKIDLQAPPGEPLYGVARVWIDKESGAILKIEGFDKKGLLLRRFEVVSGQPINGHWTLKQMRIESFAPGDSHDVLSRNYLDVLGEADK